jgi:hypothetical protein
VEVERGILQRARDVLRSERWPKAPDHDVVDFIAEQNDTANHHAVAGADKAAR